MHELLRCITVLPGSHNCHARWICNLRASTVQSHQQMLISNFLWTRSLQKATASISVISQRIGTMTSATYTYLHGSGGGDLQLQGRRPPAEVVPPRLPHTWDQSFPGLQSMEIWKQTGSLTSDSGACSPWVRLHRRLQACIDPPGRDLGQRSTGAVRWVCTSDSQPRNAKPSSNPKG